MDILIKIAEKLGYFEEEFSKDGVSIEVNQFNGGTGGSIAKYLWEAGYKDSSTIYEGIGDGARIPFNLDYDVLNGLEFNTPSFLVISFPIF